MIQLEQQQHGEFVGGWVVVGVGGLHQLPISSSLGLDQYDKGLSKSVLCLTFHLILAWLTSVSDIIGNSANGL